jgi:hypothetical protein
MGRFRVWKKVDGCVSGFAGAKGHPFRRAWLAVPENPEQ